MKGSEIKKLEKELTVRPLKIEDFEAVCALQLKCFTGMKPWKLEQFESQLRIFPEGQIGLFLNGELAASSSSLIVDFSTHSQWHNWRQISDDGYIRNHDPKGDTIYGIEIMVDPEYRGMKLARRLYEARKQLAREKNLARAIIGGRLPGYGEHASEMSVEEYVAKVISKTLIDPVLTPQLSNGFLLIRNHSQLFSSG